MQVLLLGLKLQDQVLQVRQVRMRVAAVVQEGHRFPLPGLVILAAAEGGEEAGAKGLGWGKKNLKIEHIFTQRNSFLT